MLRSSETSTWGWRRQESARGQRTEESARGERNRCRERERGERTRCRYLFEVGVVVPAQLRLKPLAPSITPATPVRLAVRSRTVPGFADEEWAIVPVVGGPKFLRVGEEGAQVCLDCCKVHSMEGLHVVLAWLVPVAARDGRDMIHLCCVRGCVRHTCVACVTV